jgi:hypothetical protein
MSETNQHCKVNKGLALKIQDLSDLAELLAEQDTSAANVFFYYTSLSEELKFVRARKGLWINENHNITIRTPI